MTDRRPRGWLRAEMPDTAAIVDAVRAAFCDTPAASAELDRMLVAGLAGEPDCFHAVEGNRVVGTPFTPRTEVRYVAEDRWQRRHLR